MRCVTEMLLDKTKVEQQEILVLLSRLQRVALAVFWERQQLLQVVTMMKARVSARRPECE